MKLLDGRMENTNKRIQMDCWINGWTDAQTAENKGRTFSYVTMQTTKNKAKTSFSFYQISVFFSPQLFWHPAEHPSEKTFPLPLIIQVILV